MSIYSIAPANEKLAPLSEMAKGLLLYTLWLNTLKKSFT